MSVSIPNLAKFKAEASCCHADELHQYFIDKYHEHLVSYQEGEVRDLTDALFKARQKSDKDDHHTRDVIPEKNVMMTMMDAFVAGFETTATMILWFMLFMVKYPDIQAKIHAELNEELGVMKEGLHNGKIGPSYPIS